MRTPKPSKSLSVKLVYLILVEQVRYQMAKAPVRHSAFKLSNKVKDIPGQICQPYLALAWCMSKSRIPCTSTFCDNNHAKYCDAGPLCPAPASWQKAGQAHFLSITASKIPLTQTLIFAGYHDIHRFQKCQHENQVFSCLVWHHAVQQRLRPMWKRIKRVKNEQSGRAHEVFQKWRLLVILIPAFD